MKHPISPVVDVVFKALLGSEKNKPLLINFLNAVLACPEHEQIIEVDILNPYSEAQFPKDKINIVDIKAADNRGRKFQIEIQVEVPKSLPKRIGYTWAKLHASQIGRGKDYDVIQPSISIWVLADNLIARKESKDFHHVFQIHDPIHNISLNNHCQIHTLELKKWSKNDTNISEDIDRWIYLLINGEKLDLDNPPSFLQTNIMRQAVETLNYFSEDEKARAIYDARYDAMLKEKMEQRDMEELRAERDEAVAEAKAALQEKNEAIAQAAQAEAKAEEQAKLIAELQAKLNSNN